MTDQVLHPYKTTGKVIALYILILTFLNNKLDERKILRRLKAAVPQLQTALNFFMNLILVY